MVDATLRVPTQPPPPCTASSCDECANCVQLKSWYDQYEKEVDELLFRSNLHTCRASTRESGASQTYGPKGCLTKDGLCAARFPRDLHSETKIDPVDGHIDLKKHEPMMNTVAPVITYIMRSNSDCTCLMSGTAIKSVILYVTDYIVKQSLKSHHIFSVAHDVLQKIEDDGDRDTDAQNATRRTLLKIVNALSTKLEIGSPMASMYLLGNPDHYTSHEFVPFYWRPFVSRTRRDVHGPENVADPPTCLTSDEVECDPVQIGQEDRKYFERSKVHDYIYRPGKFQSVCLWNWIQGYTAAKRNPKEVTTFKYLIRTLRPDMNCPIEDDELNDIPDKVKTASTGIQEQMLRQFLDESFLPEHPLFFTHAPSEHTGRRLT